MQSNAPRLDTTAVRAGFPALARREADETVAYLDGPGGTQVPQPVIEAMTDVLGKGVSNVGGAFGSSLDADRVTIEGRQAMADFLNARPSEIVFGQNMTSLTFALSRAIAGTWRPGDVIVVTSLDHDANFTPWVRAAGESGVEVRIAEFDPETGLLDPQAVVGLLDERVRLVAVCLTSNALGSMVDVATISEATHAFGATVFVDAVQTGPHHPIDVGTLGADFLVVSAYKFFGPHIGILFGRGELLGELEAWKVRPAPSDPPGKWETGTQSFEAIAGVAAAVDYLADLGGSEGSRRARLERAFRRIDAHETALAERFLEGIARLGHVRLYGHPSPGPQRCSTFAIGVEGHRASEVAAALGSRGIYVWSGNYYALNVMDRLGVGEEGLVRIGLVHYNTRDEVDRVVNELARLG